ncbi:MAG: hypothetical protein JST80_11510 [Bdellovibrionales bacterium]|nr:hypothetical protein [Bdellovibrionales bacterium]
MSDESKSNVVRLIPPSLGDESLRPDLWVNQYAKIHQIEYHYKTNSVTENGEPLDSNIFLSQMRVMAHTLGLSEMKRVIPDALNVWRREQGKEYLNQLRNELRFKKSDTDLVAEWVEAATGQRNECDIAVMRHFVWQVKRKLYGLSIDHHLFVTMFGASGGGKSVAVHKFIEPLKDVSALRDMTIFNDQFAKRAFNRNYIMFFDELGKAEDADINLLKNVITAPAIDWRGCGSEVMHSAPQNCTFIACTNIPIRERIHDPTSFRRFWQLNCASKLNWEKINLIDYNALWKSVDENSQCPLLECLDEVRAVQNHEVKTQDRIEYWLQENIEVEPFSETSPTTAELYSCFADWSRCQSIFDYEGLQTFSRGLKLRIENLGWNASSQKSHRGTVWSLKFKHVPPEDPKPKVILGLDQAPSEAVSVTLASLTETTEGSGESE